MVPSWVGLDLSQSGGVAFGWGNITFDGTSQWAIARASSRAICLRPDVVPASGDVLYALDRELRTLPPAGTYRIFSSAAPPVLDPESKRAVVIS